MSQYDYLVVGAGLSGAVFANAARRAGKSVLVGTVKILSQIDRGGLGPALL